MKSRSLDRKAPSLLAPFDIPLYEIHTYLIAKEWALRSFIFLLKAGSHVRRKHKHKHKKKYVWLGKKEAQACLCLHSCLRRPGSHVHFLVLALMLMLASYVWTGLKRCLGWYVCQRSVVLLAKVLLSVGKMAFRFSVNFFLLFKGALSVLMLCAPVFVLFLVYANLFLEKIAKHENTRSPPFSNDMKMAANDYWSRKALKLREFLWKWRKEVDSEAFLSQKVFFPQINHIWPMRKT